MRMKLALIIYIIIDVVVGIAFVVATSVVMYTAILLQAEATKELYRSITPYGESEPLEDSTQTVCIDKKPGALTFNCEGTYSQIGA
jgi:hypothetical protein